MRHPEDSHEATAYRTAVASAGHPVANEFLAVSGPIDAVKLNIDRHAIPPNAAQIGPRTELLVSLFVS
jgi:hypothetical protein